MSSRTVDFPTNASAQAAANGGFSRPNPVCTEVGVSVQGTSHSPDGAGSSHPFVEQTTTVIVFAQGAVVRLSETVAPGQILILRHMASGEEAACHVVSVKPNTNVKGYVELEFMEPAPGFWGAVLPAANAVKAPSPIPNRRQFDAEAPKAPSIVKPVTPVPAPRYTVPPSEEGNGAAGPGLAFLPDLLESLGRPADGKQRAPETTPRAEVQRPTPIRPEPDAAKPSETSKPVVAPWASTPTAPATPAAPRSDITKGVPVADGGYISDLLDTLTPVGESILRERPKSAAVESTRAAQSGQTQTLSPVPAFPKPSPSTSATVKPAAAIFVEPILAPQEPAPTGARTTPAGDLAGIGPDVAPMRYASEVVARGQLLDGDVNHARTSHGLPKPMRILAAAAAVAILLAGSAFVYRWEKRAGANVNLVASNQPNAAAVGPAAPSASSAPSPAAPAPGNAATPRPAAASTSNAPSTAKNSRGSAQTNSSAQPSPQKLPAAALAPPAPQPARGPAVAGMKMSAPTANAHQTDQATPTITAAMPGAMQNASIGGMMADSSSSGPAAPPPARTSSGVQQPRLLSAPAPVYPPEARSAHVQGNVSVDLVIDEHGNVADMTVLSGPTLLRQAARDALGQRKYAPAMLDGKPTSTHAVVVIHFQL